MQDTTVNKRLALGDSPALQEVARLFSAGQFRQAHQVCSQALSKNKRDDRAIYWNGMIAAATDHHPEAISLFKRAIEIDPGVPEYHANLGRSLVRVRQSNPAREAADKAMALEPSDALTLDTIGVIYSFAGCHDQAAQAFQQAVDLDAGNPSYWYNLGASLKFVGLFDEAETAYEQAIFLDGNYDKALAALSHLRRQTRAKNHIAPLKHRLERYPGSIQDEMRLSFALAKELDDIGDYADSFNVISDISKRWRQSISYQFEEDLCMFDAMREGFTKETVENTVTGSESDEPIFVIGMPRTGTTLVERIISSHSSVYAAGELNKMGMLVRIAAQARSNPDFRPAMIQHLLAGQLAQLGDKYIESTRPATGHTPQFVDKMPLNFLYAGFIALALPNAKIIALRRNALDTCLSNFRQLFSLRSAYYAYSYDLIDTGRYYIEFNKLMQHWEALFPGRILQIQYEDIVDQQEASTRMLLNHCDLPWENQCLSFENNKAPVATASSAQVREPINRKGLGRWKRYENQLEPLIRLFEDNGIAINRD